MPRPIHSFIRSCKSATYASADFPHLHTERADPAALTPAEHAALLLKNSSVLCSIEPDTLAKMLGKHWSFGIAVRVLPLAALLLAAAGPGRAQSPDVTAVSITPGAGLRHFGDDPRCASGLDPECKWTPRGDGIINVYGFNWLRYDFSLPERLRRSPQLAVLVQDVSVSYEVYANGHPIGETVSVGLLHANSYHRTIFTFPSSLAPDGRLTLVFRCHPQGARSAIYGNQIKFLPYVVAPPELMQGIVDEETLTYLRAYAPHYLCFAGVGFAAFVFLLLFSVNTQLREYLWLGLNFGAVAMLRIDEISHILHTGLPLWLTSVIYGVFNGITPLVLIEFVFSFLKRPVPKVFRIVQILGLLVSLYPLSGLPIPVSLATFVNDGGTTSILLATLAQLLVLPTCFRSKMPEMRWIGASILFITIENSARMAKQLGIPAPAQDVMWRGIDIDVRGIAYLLFAMVMLVAMTFRLRRIQDRNRAIEQELAAARSVQQILIPEELPSVPGLAVESAYLPAQQVGGDFFQVLPTADGGLLLVVGDVSGKGLPAAMLVSVLVGSIRSTAEFTSDPAELLAHLNQRLIGRTKEGGFSTAIAALIPPHGPVILANAGHLAPYLDGKEVELPSALPLGIVSGTKYESSQVQLRPGSRLTFYSDGVVEAQNETGELFGFERGQQISTRGAAAIVEAARRFGQSDDITVVTVERRAAAAEQHAEQIEPSLAPA
jgi:phosphoserine phosphatase RsbU/P